MKLWAVVAALAVTAVGGTVAIKTLSPDLPSVRSEGIALLQEASRINASQNLPEFAAWPMREDLKKCGTEEINLPKFTRNPLADFENTRHNEPDIEVSLPRRVAVGFHYSEPTYKRLCGRVIESDDPDNKSPYLREGLQRIDSWWFSLPQGSRPSEISPPFSEGMKASAVGWYVLHKPKSETDGTIVNLTVLNEQGEKKIKTVQITVPTLVSPTCSHLDNLSWTPETPREKPVLLTIDSFFWIQLQDGEKVLDGQCGDYLLLTNFNLMRRRDKPDQKNHRWLWAAYWWDPDTKPYNMKPDLASADVPPSVWDNYSMDVTYDSDRFMFNPAREVENTNCAFCHFAGGRIPLFGERHGAGPIDAPLNYMSTDFIFAPGKI